MAGKTAVLTVHVVTDASKASAGLESAEKSVGKMQGGMAKAGLAAAAAGAAVLAFGVSAAKAAAEDAQGQRFSRRRSRTRPAPGPKIFRVLRIGSRKRPRRPASPTINSGRLWRHLLERLATSRKVRTR